MHFFEAFIYGMAQGLTEFLPVSSDGHIALASFLLGFSGMPLSFVIFLHAATLLATLIYFRKEAQKLLQDAFRLAMKPTRANEEEYGFLRTVLIASIPTAVVGLLLEPRVEALSAIPWVVGLGFWCTALVLVSTRYAPKRETENDGALPSLPLASALLLGLAQGAAVLPGLSRSACTIAAAMALGLAPNKAFQLSFALSMPAVGGAVILGLRHGTSFEDSGIWISAAVAFVFGLLALKALAAVVRGGRIDRFSWYLWPVGLLTILLSLFRPVS